MSKTLNLIGAAWDAVHSSASRGRRSAALARMTRLLCRPDLPTSVAAKAHRFAGELLIDSQRYPLARRHLRAAAVMEVGCAKVYYLLGLAHELDPYGCDRRAALCFRKAYLLEQGNGLYRAAFGRAAVRAGRLKMGVRELLLAAEAAAGDVPIIRIVTDGLLQAGRFKAAERVVMKARFLNPHCGEMLALWERVRFDLARKSQRQQRCTTRHRQEAAFATEGDRVVLPIVRNAVPVTKSRKAGLLRKDAVSLPTPHFPRLHLRKADL